LKVKLSKTLANMSRFSDAAMSGSQRGAYDGDDRRAFVFRLGVSAVIRGDPLRHVHAPVSTL
jgi:hypothetical protein